MGLDHIRNEIERMRVQVGRQRKEILQLQRAGIPTVPGTTHAVQTAADAGAAADAIGYPVIVKAVTDYVARRMVEREQALVTTIEPEQAEAKPRRRGGFWTFVLGFVVGAAALFALALYAALHNL